MNKSLFKSFLLLIAFVISAQAQSDLLTIGDTIDTYLQRNPATVIIPSRDISSWVEGKNIAILKYQTGFDSTKPNFLSSRGIAFGVLEGTPPKAYYLFDTDGDGILDYRTDRSLLPIWLVSRISKVVDTASPRVKNILDAFFNALQSDSGLILNNQTKPAYATLFGCAQDTLFPNRDLVYQLFYYLGMTKRDSTQALSAMRIMEKNYTKRFHSLHPLIKLYELESALQLKKDSLASVYLSELQTIAPEFIPAKYYAYVLENDKAKKSEKLGELKRLYPHHWIIKRIK